MRRHKANMKDGDLLTDAVRGALAGAVATWVMGQATSYLYQQEEKQARQAENEAREGKTAYGVGTELSDEQRKKYGSAIHWGLGVGAGAVYGALRNRVPGADAAGGLLFGTAFWLLVDEAANPLLGLTKGPTAFPWQTHARGLAGHLVFGVAANAALEVMEAV